MSETAIVLAGTHERNLSPDGRIHLPREWVEILRQNGAEQWYLLHAVNHLILIPVTESSTALSQLGPPFDRIIIATLPIVDDAINVPMESLRRVGISDEVELIGAGNSVQIWPPRTAPAPTQADLNRAIEELGL